MFATAIARMRAAVAALRGRLPVVPTVPVRPAVPVIPNLDELMASVAAMKAAAALHTKNLDQMSATLDAARRNLPN